MGKNAARNRFNVNFIVVALFVWSMVFPGPARNARAGVAGSAADSNDAVASRLQGEYADSPRGNAASIINTSNHTIVIDGVNDFAADEDVPGTSGSTWYFTWDASNFFFGATNADVASNSGTKWLHLYIDTDPGGANGTTTGVNYNTQAPTLPFKADYHFRWKADNSFTDIQKWNGSAWVSASATFGGAGDSQIFQSGAFVEARISRSFLGSPTAIKIVGGFINEVGGGEATYFMTPSGNAPDGYDKNYSQYLGFSVDPGVSPDSSKNINSSSSKLVISQLYSSGGNSGATLKNDFVELLNRSTVPVSINGWSLQYASSTGSTWLNRFDLPPTTIQPGQYYLVQLQGGANGLALPTPDAQTTSIDMSGNAGKIALVSSTTALSGPCPASTSIQDFVGYGGTANCNEGGTNAPAPSLANALFRASGGCSDSDLNGSDFSSAAVAPRNSASAYNYCGAPTPTATPTNTNTPTVTPTTTPTNTNTPTVTPTNTPTNTHTPTVTPTDTNTPTVTPTNTNTPTPVPPTPTNTPTPNYADYCVIQYPASFSVASGANTGLVYGRIYESSLTPAGGADPSIGAELGYGPLSSDPIGNPNWTWFSAAFNAQYGNDDEYMASFTAPTEAVNTQYAYAYRFSLDAGAHFTYCDTDGAGTNPGLSFDPNLLGLMTVNAPTPTPTNTPIPPTATPTNTPAPPTETPTNTPVPPTATPTNTPVPPTETPTNTPVPPTETPTNTPVPPTETPTNTPVPPTETPTNTPVPPTETPTNTPVPPTETPTNTPVPPTETPTNTPVPPTETPTNTPVPPTATPTNTPASAMVSGIVRLQSRSSPGTPGTITLADTAAIFGTVTASFDAGTGAFSVAVQALAGGSTYILTASHDLYLSSQKTLTVFPGGTYAQAATTLKGGDADNNGVVGIPDLACIGGAFGGPAAPCGTGSSDLNGDGVVNIFDLVLAGSDFGLTSPQPWP